VAATAATAATATAVATVAGALPAATSALGAMPPVQADELPAGVALPAQTVQAPLGPPPTALAAPAPASSVAVVAPPTLAAVVALTPVQLVATPSAAAPPAGEASWDAFAAQMALQLGEEAQTAGGNAGVVKIPDAKAMMGCACARARCGGERVLAVTVPAGVQGDGRGDGRVLQQDADCFRREWCGKARPCASKCAGCAVGRKRGVLLTPVWRRWRWSFAHPGFRRSLSAMCGNVFLCPSVQLVRMK
jgi:hypothetical protein